MLFSDNVPVEQEIALKERRPARLARDGTGLRHRGRRRSRAGLRQRRCGPARSASSPHRAPGAQQVSACSTPPTSASRQCWASADATCPPRSAAGRPWPRCRCWIETRPPNWSSSSPSPPDPTVAEQVRVAPAGLRHPPRSSPSWVQVEADLTATTAKVACALGIGRSPAAEWPAPYGTVRPAGLPGGLFSGGTLCDESMAIAADRLGPHRVQHTARSTVGTRCRPCVHRVIS